MDNQTKNLLAAAVVGGYVLGRTKKGRIALTAATFLAGKRLGLDPRTLVVEGVRRIGEIPQVMALQEQFREESMEAGRNALTAIANRSLNSLADAISSRTAGLGPGRDDQDAEEEHQDEEAEDEDAEEEEAEDEEAEDEEADEPPRPPRSSLGSDRSAPAERHTGKRKAERAAHRKAAPAKKTTSPKPATKQTSARTGRRR